MATVRFVRRAVVLVSALLALAFAGQAAAREVVVPDDQGRSIRFDVRAEGVDVEWYAALLRAAPHADEISTVRIELVSPTELVDRCGQGASGCYRRRVITVAALETETNAHTFVHEYGHHVDASRGVAGAPEPNGSSTWWRARGHGAPRRDPQRLSQLPRRGLEPQRGRDLRGGLRAARAAGDPHRIPWLEGPNEGVLAAILHDLGLGPEPMLSAPPQVKPLAKSRGASWRHAVRSPSSRSACSGRAGACAQPWRWPAPRWLGSARGSSSAATTR